MIRSARFLEHFQVTAHALGRQSLTVELSDGAGFVTGIAIRHGMSADEREAVLVFIHVMHRNLPTVHPVAHVALRTVPAAMNVGMAILAIRTYVGEHRVDVAFLAGHIGVQTSQGEARLVVIKLRLAAYRPP